jgi:hypothetical protein
MTMTEPDASVPTCSDHSEPGDESTYRGEPIRAEYGVDLVLGVVLVLIMLVVVLLIYPS